MIAADIIRRWREAPQIMCRELFGITPDAWQDEALAAFPTTRRMAMKACAGPGKTFVLAVLAWNFLITRPHPIIGMASINAQNLKSGLWAEMARLGGKADLTQQMFTQTEKAIFANDHPQTWRAEARTWSKDADREQIGNALAGLHANFVMWILDETGDYPEAVMPVCEGIFNGNPVEAHIVQAGNPTRLSGPLYRACTIARDIWKVIEITADPDDPKRTPRVSVEIAREQIKQYGRDNPWVLVRIFGQFPPSDFNALIGPDEVSAAMHRTRTPNEIQNAPMVLGIDVARFGDDQSVIFPRRGLQGFKPIKYRNVDSTFGAGVVSRLIDEQEVDGVFIDNAGLGGGGWIDALISMGRTPIGIDFGGETTDKVRYHNKRAEMYFDAVEWIKRGGALYESAELLSALTQTTYTFQRDSGKMILEPKDSIKTKLGYSPDEADAFVLTFAQTVAKKVRGLAINRPAYQAQHEWRPHQDGGLAGAVSSSYDPFRK
jgi:phage terminase large subunit